METDKRKERLESSSISMLLTFYRLQYSQDLLMRRVLYRLESDGKRPYLHRETKQRHNRMISLAREQLRLACLGADNVTENITSMAMDIDRNRDIANSIARMCLLMIDRFADDPRRMSEFVDEFCEQTGGEDNLSVVEVNDLHWFRMK